MAVPTSWGETYALDIGLPEIRFAAEYDGEAYHGPDQEAYDENRRGWLTDERGWAIEVARRSDIHGPAQDIHVRLQRSYDQALRNRRSR